MRRLLTACVLVVSMLGGLGCHSITESTIKSAKVTLQQLRTVRSEVVPMLSTDPVEIGTKTWTVRGLWDNRLAGMIVNARSTIAGMKRDKGFDTVRAAGEEGVTKEPR